MKDEIVKSLLEMPHQDGDRLPSIRILMQTMRAASGTVQNAIALLKAQGLVYSDPGRGTFWGQRQREDHTGYDGGRIALPHLWPNLF